MEDSSHHSLDQRKVSGATSSEGQPCRAFLCRLWRLGLERALLALKTTHSVQRLATPGCALLPCRTISQRQVVVRRCYRPLNGGYQGRQRSGALGQDGGLEDGGLLGTSSMCGTLLWRLQRQHIFGDERSRKFSLNKIHLL